MSARCTYFMYPSCSILILPSPMSTMGVGSGMATVSHQHGEAVHDSGRPMASRPGHNIEVLVTPQLQSFLPP